MHKLNDQRLFRELCYINGEWTSADGGASAPVTNPANGEVIGSVPNCGAAETRKALEAAQVALPGWRALTAKERAKNLRSAFTVHGGLPYAHVLIVDDVITTGTTVHQLARVIKRAGVRRVSALAVARAT